MVIPSPRIRVPLRSTVLSFIEEWIVQLVVLSNTVISVKAHIRSVGVTFMARVELLQTVPCLPSPNLNNCNLPMRVIV